MSEFIDFIEKWPLRNNSPEKKLKLLKKALTLMEHGLIIDPDNREYWKKKVNRIWGLIRETEGEIIRLEIEGKEAIEEAMTK